MDAIVVGLMVEWYKRWCNSIIDAKMVQWMVKCRMAELMVNLCYGCCNGLMDGQMVPWMLYSNGMLDGFMNGSMDGKMTY